MPDSPPKPKNSVHWVRVLLASAVLGSCVVSLLLPLNCRGPRRNYDREAAIEITQLEAALTSFKAEFGIYPPSRITLQEDNTAWDLDPRSKSHIRRLWPDFDFHQNCDFNADGDTTDEHTLTGAECLVFFLGGLRDNNGQLIGFSKNPRLPFSRNGINREGPYFQFDVDRFTDVDKDSFVEYGDNFFGPPYLYASSEHGGYRSRDLAVYPDGDKRNMTDVYRNALKKGLREYQIISAGQDGEYGEGGLYSDELEFKGMRRSEKDNITSFADRRLGDF